MNYEELARCTDDFNGAMCKAVCVEAVSSNENAPRLTGKRSVGTQLQLIALGAPEKWFCNDSSFIIVTSTTHNGKAR